MIDFVQSVKVAVVIPRLVLCEFCHTEYVYEMNCSHEVNASVLKYGVEGAEREAFAWAEKLIRDQVTQSCEAVPCPACSCYQKQMSEHLAVKKYEWLMFFAIPLLLAGGLSLAVALFSEHTHDRLIALAVIGGSVIGFLALYAVESVLVRRHDANRQPEPERAALAKERAVLLQAFRDQHVQRDRAAYESYLREPLGEAEKAPFVVDVWLKEEELTTGQPLTVALPTGATTLLELDESLDSGAVYPLYSTTGEELPFLARVCVFNRSPFLVRS